MSLATLSWIGLVIYIAAMIVLGVMGMRRTRSMADYAVAARFGPLFVALCFTGTFTSAATFMGYPGLVYKFGWPGMWAGAGFATGAVAAMILTARKLTSTATRIGSLSVPDFVGDRYKSDLLRVIVAVLVPIIYIAVLTAQYKGVGTLFEVVLGVDYRVGVLLCAVVVTLYIALGGTIADVYTDVVQTSIMTIVVLFVAIYGFIYLGGFAGIDAAVAKESPNLTSAATGWWAAPLFTPLGVFALWLMHVFHVGSQPYMVKTFWAVRTPKLIGQVMLYSAIILFLHNFVGLTGIYARAIVGPGLKNVDAAFPALIAAIFPPVVGALVLIAILSAAMSTVDGLLVTVSTCAANDVYRKAIVARKREPTAEDERRALTVGRIACLVFGLAPAYWAATKPPEFLLVLLWFGLAGVGSMLAGPVIVGLYMKRATPIGALVSMIVGLALYAVLFIPYKLGPNISGAAGAVAGALTMIVVSLATRQTLSEELINRLFPPAPKERHA